MAIVLKYGAPGPILLAGAAGGRGHRENEYQDDALKLWQQQQQQNFQSRQLSQQQSFAGGQAALDREYRSELQGAALKESQTERDYRAGQQKSAQDFQAGQQKGVLEARAGESVLDREQRALADRQRQEFVADQNTLTGLRRGELELPQAAQRRLQQLDAGLVEAMKLSPAEQGEFRQKYEAEKRNLLRLATPSQEMSYEDRVRKNLGTNYEQYKSLPWQFNNQGEMSLPTGFKLPGNDQEKSKQQLTEDFVTRYEKHRKELDEETGLPISDEVARKKALDDQMATGRATQWYSGRGSQATASAQQPAGEDAIWGARAAEGARAQSQAISAAAGRPAQQPQSAALPATQTAQQAQARKDGMYRISDDTLLMIHGGKEERQKITSENKDGVSYGTGSVRGAASSSQIIDERPKAGPQTQMQPASQLTPAQQPLSLAIPQPKTVEEASKLPRGSTFRWTDGSIRKVP